ncbi:MAG: single-stranded DNA-binding protein, partial [Proteobacteria bacterium]|nr:single-stranded DNA-binding protein [Pseudomonadota bacterium]
NPFDLWEGANFKLKIRKVEGYQNYDKSEFDKPSPLSKDDDDLERIWKSEHKLGEFLDKSNFKSYDQIKERLNVVLGIAGAVGAIAGVSSPVQRVAQQNTALVTKTAADDDSDEDLSYFEKLAEED